MSDHTGSYLKKHAEALVKDLGIERAAEICGKSKATLGRYYSMDTENADRYMPVDVVARLEAEASFPHMTHALADLARVTLSFDEKTRNAREGHLNSDIVALSQRFAMLMGEYHVSIADNTISVNEAKRLLGETQALQKVLLDRKLRLEEESASENQGRSALSIQIVTGPWFSNSTSISAPNSPISTAMPRSRSALAKC